MYKEYQPAPQLSPYIDAYWTSSVDTAGTFVQRILPDTCTDIICNLGADLHVESVEKSVLKADNCYLLGTMTRFSDVTVGAGTKVFGIRFKTFGMCALLGFSLSGTSNKRSLLGPTDFDFRRFVSADGTPRFQLLNNYFIGRLPQRQGHNRRIVGHILNAGGKLTISQLAESCHTKERQLERMFKDQAGITVKELCNQVRLLNTITALKKRDKQESLLSLALDNGFYDHAHLTNNLRKYTGYAPSHFTK